MTLHREAAPLRVQAVNALRRKIVSGEFAPATRLIEKRLEEILGVSRTVVREALRQLESEHLISMSPNVGPVVRALSYDDVVHLYQVRATLESAASSFAAESASPAEVAALRDAYTVLVERVDQSQIDDLIELKNDFYVALIAASGNPIIGEMLGNVQARISQLRGVTLQAPGRSRHMTAELGRVVAAIEAADPKRAAKESRAHVQAAEKIALRHAALSDSIIGPLTGATITDIGAAS